MGRADDARGPHRVAIVGGVLGCRRRCCRSCSVSRSRGCWRGSASPAAACCALSVLLPIVFPPVVGGIALLFAFGRRGLVGQYLYDWFGIRLPFTTAGAVMAATFVAMPFFVITVEAALRTMDRRLEDAARTLNAQPVGHVPLRHLARHTTVVDCRRGALLGARARRVRCDDHVRRQLPRQDPNDPARGVSRARTRYRRRSRAQPRAARDLGRRPACHCAIDGSAGSREQAAACTPRSACVSVCSTSRSTSMSRPVRPLPCSARTDRARPLHLRCLAGLLPVDTGRIDLDGGDARRSRDRRMGRARAAARRRRVPGLSPISPPQRARQRRVRTP